MDAAAHAILPFEICQQWQLQVGYERSFKVRRGRVLANRYLIGIPIRQLTIARARELAARLRMPSVGDAEFWSFYAQANLLLVGFENSEPGCVYKLYLEFDEQIVDPGSNHDGPHRLLHRGLKWDASKPLRYRTSDYRWFPGLDADAIRDRIGRSLRGLTIRDGVLAIVDNGLSRCDARLLRYLQVEEGGRQSFDLNVYPAGMLVDDVFGGLEQLMKVLEVPQRTISQLEAIVRPRSLGHVAAGRDGSGEEFLTLYFEPA